MSAVSLPFLMRVIGGHSDFANVLTVPRVQDSVRSLPISDEEYTDIIAFTVIVLLFCVS
jgi:hypothetical protein